MKKWMIVIGVGLWGVGGTAGAQDSTSEDVFEIPPGQPDLPTAPSSPARETSKRGSTGRLPPQAQPYQVPYQPGMPIPVGTKIVHRFRWGLIAAGIPTFMVPYSLSVFVEVATQARHGELLVPVVGPLFVLNETDQFDSILIFNSIAQAAGVTMMVIGFIGRDYVEGWVVPDGPGLTVQPHLQGINLTYRY